LKILVDENIPRRTVDWLQSAGHDVRDVRQTSHQGLHDSQLWAAAMADGRLLISTDRGFTAYRKVEHHGILIVRLRQPNRERIHQAVLLALARFQEAEWPGLLVVVRDATLSVSRSGGAVEQI
jgi:predicted nuclease of predicted toxin-antitoxin system